MSGHNKWSTIKHKKGAADAKRGKIFSKLAKEIMVAAKAGGGDMSMNPTLRTMVQKAKGVNMPNENIDRAIKKGTGGMGDIIFEEIVYEGYAAGGVGLVVKVLTDNKNRAAAEVRHIFTKSGSSLAGQGAVSRNFERRGTILVDASSVDEDLLMEVALEAGADDIVQDGDNFEVQTQPQAFNGVTEALEKAEITTISAEVGMVPLITQPLTDAGQLRSVLKFISALEDNDDVQDVYTNFDAPDELIEEVSAEL